MKHHVLYLLTWILYTAFFGVMYLIIKPIELLFVASFVIGSLIGFLIPILLDVFLPLLMEGNVSLSKETVQSVVQETAVQVKKGNVYDANQKPTPLRSYPLLFGYLVMAIFILTSTSNWIGKGFVLGLGLSLVLDLWFSKSPIDHLRSRWFSVFTTNLNDRELTYFVYLSVIVFSVISILSAVL